MQHYIMKKAYMQDIVPFNMLYNLYYFAQFVSWMFLEKYMRGKHFHLNFQL